MLHGDRTVDSLLNFVFYFSHFSWCQRYSNGYFQAYIHRINLELFKFDNTFSYGTPNIKNTSAET